MRRHILVTAVTAAAATLAALAPAPAAPAGAAARATPAARGAQLWVARYNGPAGKQDGARSMAVSPDGSTVFVTGSSDGGPATGWDYATAAYSAVTGRQLWVSRYNGPANGVDAARSVAVSPGGARVFVTGFSVGGPATGTDYATVAYSAATGRQLWVSRYNGPGNGVDVASSVAVSPGGARVFVTGSSAGRTAGDDYATVAYGAAAGRRLWASRYNGPGNGYDAARSVAVSPGGARVFVTGYSVGRTAGNAYATVAYGAAAGRRLWVSRYNGPANSSEASSVAVSPAGTTVYVTGDSLRLTARDDYATVAYGAAAGRRLWVSRYNGPGNGEDTAVAVAVSPAGTTVYVTGTSDGGTAEFDYATVAYRG